MNNPVRKKSRDFGSQNLTWCYKRSLIIPRKKGENHAMLRLCLCWQMSYTLPSWPFCTDDLSRQPPPFPLHGSLNNLLIGEIITLYGIMLIA